MNLTSRKPLVFALLSAASLAAIASCSDDTSGPPVPRAGFIAIAPSFSSNAASIVEVAIVAILLERTVDGSIVLDTAIALEPGTDSVDVSLPVPILSNDDTFLLTLSLIDTAGDTVFRGEPQTVTPSLTGGTDAPPIIVPLVFTGVGSNAAAVAFLTANPTVFFGDSVELTAVALDSTGLVIANTPIAFTSLDPVKATVPDKAVGIVVGGLQRGQVLIEAKLLTDQADTVAVIVQPVPSALLPASGDGQTGTVGAALADSLAVRVIAADSLGVAGVAVLFSSADTTASLSADTVTTDAQGLAAVAWTLGTVAGGQQVVATANGIADTVSFTATAQAGVALQLAFSVEPASTTPGSPFTAEVVVQDASANTVTTDSTTSVSLGILTGTGTAGATLSGTTSVVVVGGVASFSGLSIDSIGTLYQLEATATGLTAATSLPFDIVLPVPANGGFESGVLTPWTLTNAGSGDFFVMSGTTTPQSFSVVLPPPEGTWAAVTDQGGPGMHIIHQDVVVPTSGTTALSAIVYLENQFGAFIVDSASGLRHDLNANQHFRVDIMDPSAPVDDVGSGVLLNVFLTLPGDSTSLPYTTITADLTPFAGLTIRLRFARVDNQFFFNAAVDAVSVTTTGSGAAPLLATPPPSAPVRRHAPAPAADAPRYRRHR